jgi:uncharacterized protein YjbJ (UPF0337 family)
MNPEKLRRLTGRRGSNLGRGYNKMKPSTEDEIVGKVHEVKGTIKEKVGELTNDPDLEGEGIGEKLAGKVLKKLGQVEKALGNRFISARRSEKSGIEDGCDESEPMGRQVHNICGGSWSRRAAGVATCASLG